MIRSAFSEGRRWFCVTHGRARFWFVILGPANSYAGNPSKVHNWCRIEVHPEDLENKLPGYKLHGTKEVYSHKHLRKFAKLED